MKELLINATNASLLAEEFVPKNKPISSYNASSITNFYNSRTRVTKRILTDINLEINTGDRIALIGENGSGKTTLLKVLAGIRTPNTGEVDFNTKKILLIGNHKLGFVPNASVKENIITNGLTKGISYSHITSSVEKILDFAELSFKGHSAIKDLSAGQKMRVALAVSLHSKAEVYLIDEWIGALDKRFFTKFNKKLTKKLADSKALVLASHNMNLVDKMCNKIIVIERGKIKQKNNNYFDN